MNTQLQLMHAYLAEQHGKPLPLCFSCRQLCHLNCFYMGNMLAHGTEHVRGATVHNRQCRYCAKLIPRGNTIVYKLDRDPHVYVAHERCVRTPDYEVDNNRDLERVCLLVPPE